MRTALNLALWALFLGYLYFANSDERFRGAVVAILFVQSYLLFLMYEDREQLKDRLRHIEENTSSLLNQPPIHIDYDKL